MSTRVASNKGKKLPPEPLSGDEVRALIKACSKRAPTGIRNRALLAVLYRGGLRLDEALSLKPKDIHAQTGELRILHGKGDKARVVALPEGAWEVLQRWLDKRASLGINGHSTVFCTLRGEKVQSAYVRALLPRLAKRAGIEKRVHAHGLRHTCAFELANEGTPMHVVQAVLGHARLTTTARYIAHLNPKEVVDTMRSREWKL